MFLCFWYSYSIASGWTNQYRSSSPNCRMSMWKLFAHTSVTVASFLSSLLQCHSPEVQDVPDSLEIADSNLGYTTAGCGWELPGSGAQLALESQQCSNRICISFDLRLLVSFTVSLWSERKYVAWQRTLSAVLVYACSQMFEIVFDPLVLLLTFFGYILLNYFTMSKECVLFSSNWDVHWRNKFSEMLSKDWLQMICRNIMYAEWSICWWHCVSILFVCFVCFKTIF